MPARAYDSSMFVVVCNLIDDNGDGNVYPGNSMILNPMGEVIAEAGEGEKRLAIADLKARDHFQVRKDGGWAFFVRYRRPELYGLVADKQF